MKNKLLPLLLLLLTVSSCTLVTDSSSSSSQPTSEPPSHGSIITSESSSISSSSEVASEPSSSSEELPSSSEVASSSSETPSSSEEQIKRFNQISDVYTLINTLNKNDKGTVTGETIVLTAQYVQKLDASLALFSDEAQVIQVYGDKINNGLSLGATYDVTAKVAFYIHKPTINLISMIKRNDIAVTPPSLTPNQTVTAANIKAYDKTQGSHFAYVYHFEGYIKMKTWGNNDKYALADSLNAVVYDSNAKRNDTLFIKNHDENIGDPLLDDALYGELRVSVDFVMYGYNTLFFTWQVHIIDSTFNLL